MYARDDNYLKLFFPFLSHKKYNNAKYLLFGQYIVVPL